MNSVKYLTIIALTFLSAILFAQEYYEGSSFNPNNSQSSQIYYQVAESNTEKFYFANFKIYDSAKKKMLYEINLTNDKAANKLTYTIAGINPETKTISYNTATSGLFYSNNSLQDVNIEQTSLFDPSFRYILSFKDTFRTNPTIHKITTVNGAIIFLDPITVKRIERHKSIFAAYQSTISLAEQQKIEEQKQKAQIQKHIADSILFVNAELEKKKIADSIYAEQFTADLLVQAEKFYNLWRTDTMKVTLSMTQILEKYASEQEKMYETRIEDELYTGDRHRRKKQGVGLLVKKKLVENSTGYTGYELSFYSGTFNEDTFQGGFAYIREGDKSYSGNIAKGNKNGLGLFKFKNGNYLLGNFENGIFEKGISNWIYKEQGKHYFGSLIADVQTGYGEMHVGKSIYIGNFDNGRLIDGYAKEVDEFGNVRYFKFENALKVDARKAQVERFLETLSIAKKKVLLSDRSNLDENSSCNVAVDSVYLAKVEFKTKYKVPHYFGVSLGAAIPVFGFELAPLYGLIAPKVSIDAWFRMANAIGFKIKMGCSTYSVNENYSKEINAQKQVGQLGTSVNIRNRYDMLWFIHFYNAGLGLNLGGKKGSFEVSALTGLAVIHQPMYYYPTDNLYWDKGRPQWNFQGEAAIRINCNRKFALRFGATYFLTQVTDFNGYAYDDTGFITKSGGNLTKLWIHSIDPFISFLGLF